MKVAIVHDWLVIMRGGEKVLEAICELYPQADLYTIYSVKSNLSETINRMNISVSFINKLPFSKNNFRFYLPLFPLAIENFNFAKYDLIISTNHCVAKGILPAATAKHICYCHTPMRYVWDFQEDYFGKREYFFSKRRFAEPVIKYLRDWDQKVSCRVDEFIANSINISNKIKKYYGRDSQVIYPPIETDYFNCDPFGVKGDFFLVVSALVPYKRLDIVIETFNSLGKKIKVIGEGPLKKTLMERANSNIEFLGWVEKNTLKQLYQECRALICTQEEDFGISALEAQACGSPVIAYAKGGALETVIHQETGLLYHSQTGEGLMKAVKEFEELFFEASHIRAHALRFNNKDKFKENISNFITSKLARFDEIIV